MGEEEEEKERERRRKWGKRRRRRRSPCCLRVAGAAVWVGNCLFHLGKSRQEPGGRHGSRRPWRNIAY